MASWMNSAEIQPILSDVMASLDYDLASNSIFKARWSADVEQYLYWRMSRTDVALLCEFGLRHIESELYARECARLYGGLPGSDLQSDFENHGCSMRFTLARLTSDAKQIILIFARITEAEFRSQITDIVQGRVLPALSSIVSVAALRDVLVYDQQRCPWYAANGALLAAKLAKLDRMLGLSPQETEAVLTKHESDIQQGLRADRYAQVYISKILSHDDADRSTKSG